MTPALSHTDDPIPLVDSLSDIYSSSEAVLTQGQRWNSITDQFKQHFDGQPPSFIARAPGRFVIIGEHIDHMGYGVLPAAIELDILMAVRVVPRGSSSGQKQQATSSDSPGQITFDLRNTTSRFEPAVFDSGLKETDSVQLLHSGNTRWANYFKVAWKGLQPHLPQSILDSDDVPARIEVLVDGTIPPESSLSSSAAMTVCSSIVILESLGARQYISRSEMAEVAIESERYVGVASGGMDQSASIFGSRNSALHVVFHPKLAVTKVNLPPSEPECSFVVANTLVVSDKKVNGPVQYNLRVVELWLAARLFARKNGLPLDDSTKTWRKLMQVYFDKHPLPLDSNMELAKVHSELGEEAAQIWFMGKLADEQIPQGMISQSQAEELTGYHGEAFQKEFLSQFEVRAPEGFNLHSRVRHVFAESLRVHQFRALCLSTSASPTDDTYQTFGKLMDASHASLAKDYENTCPELESVISIARSSGSLGSRLIGAGWGGSTVHLVRKSDVGKVIQALRDQYYAKRWPDLSEQGIQEAVLESRPAGGACVYRVSQ